jgi:aryl-alcohol dehydrogenase-like predicted oxidoreductase
MKTVPLGHTGQQVSALCLGAMFLGTRQDEPTSFALLDQYVEAGGTFIDTANVYAHWAGGQGGDSESLLGRWMKARGNRDRLFVATKVGFDYPGAPRGLTPGFIREFGAKDIKEDAEHVSVTDRNWLVRTSRV